MRSGFAPTRFLQMLSQALLSAAFCIAPALAAAQASATDHAHYLAGAETPLSTAAIVAGILNYTAWPGPSRSLTVCISRSSREAPDLAQQLEQTKTRHQLLLTRIEANTPLPENCDLVYFDGWSAPAARMALRKLDHKPVLTIGHEPEFCSDGGLFCLSKAGSSTRFEVNLDAVTRSGLRVNAQVLRLAKPRGQVSKS